MQARLESPNTWTLLHFNSVISRIIFRGKKKHWTMNKEGYCREQPSTGSRWTRTRWPNRTSLSKFWNARGECRAFTQWGWTIPYSQSKRWHKSAHRRQILQTPRRSSTTSDNPDKVEERDFIIPRTLFPSWAPSYTCLVGPDGVRTIPWGWQVTTLLFSKESHCLGIHSSCYEEETYESFPNCRTYNREQTNR